MPDVRGLSLAAARDTLDVHTLTVGEVRTVRGGPTASEARVVVSAQNPQPGQRVRRGSAVRLELGERVAPVRETRPNARPTPDLRRTPAEPTVGAPGRAPAELPAPPVDPEAGDPPPSDEDAPF
jgi:beta-lactam-binding protein with PASTA domain